MRFWYLLEYMYNFKCVILHYYYYFYSVTIHSIVSKNLYNDTKYLYKKNTFFLLKSWKKIFHSFHKIIILCKFCGTVVGKHWFKQCSIGTKGPKVCKKLIIINY